MTLIAPTIRLVRAVGGAFVRRILRTILIIVALCAVVLHGAGIVLTTINAWWWLLEGVCIVVTLVVVVLATLVFVALHFLEPKQTSDQKLMVRNYVDKLERVAENVKTPLPMIGLQVARDVVWPRPDGFIETIAKDSQTLAPDFIALKQSFDTPNI